MKKETAFQQILNDSDSHMDTFGAIQALAACALERDPKSAMEQLHLESVIKDSHFYPEFLSIINSDYVPQAPKEYARFEEMKVWLSWLEQIALAYGLLFFIDKENTDSQNEIFAFLKKQESELKNRQELWLYRNQAEKAEKMVFPWNTILSDSQEIPLFENCKSESAVEAIVDHLFLKELTPHQEIALIGFLLYADKKHPLVCHYKEVSELGMTVWMLPEEEETKKLRSKAREMLCSVVKGNDEISTVNEEAFEKCVIPHIGEIKFFEETTRDLETLVQVVFADGRIVTLHKQEDSEEDVFARYIWQDPILGETQIVIKAKDCMDIFYVLRDQKEKILKAMESEISIHNLLILETASLLEHSSIMENCEAVKELLFCEEEQEINETLLKLPLLVLETRILLERLVEKNKQLGILWQGVSDEISMQDIALANLDQIYEEKEFDQVFLLFDEEESLLPYVEGLENSESFAWWVMPLLLMSKSEEEVEKDFLQALSERIK